MAEFAVAARDLGTGYKQGDPISVLPDGAVWGTLDTLPNVWIVKVPNVSLSIGQQAIEELMEPAMPGDPELGAPDPSDRFIRRGRRRVRAFLSELPQPKQDELNTVGVTTLSLGQARSVYRKMTWNRTTGQIEDTGIQEFG